MQAPETKRPAKAVQIVGFLFIVCSIASILLVKPPTIQPADVAKRLQEFSANLNNDAMKVNRQAVLSYGAITTEGTAYEKYAVIQGLHFSLSAKVGSADGSWTMDTDKVVVTFDPLNLKRMVFKFASPLSFTVNGQKTLVSMQTPLKVGYYENSKGDEVLQTLITLRMPSEVTLLSQTATGGTPAVEPTKMVINYDGLPEINIKSDKAGKLQETHLDLRNIIAQSGGDHDINVGAVASSFEEKAGPGNKINGAISLTVSDFIRRGADGKAIGTCSFASNIGYSSLETLLTIFGLPDKAEATGTINKMVLTCDDFTIKVEGDFAFRPADMLPSGTATMTIENAKAFLASPLLSEQTRTELTAALPKITGQAADAANQVIIPLKRDANGELMLGSVSAHDAGITAVNQWFHVQ